MMTRYMPLYDQKWVQVQSVVVSFFVSQFSKSKFGVKFFFCTVNLTDFFYNLFEKFHQILHITKLGENFNYSFL